MTLTKKQVFGIFIGLIICILFGAVLHDFNTLKTVATTLIVLSALCFMLIGACLGEGKIKLDKDD